KMFAKSLDIRMAQYGVKVTLVSPGFIDTPMSQQVTEPKPFLMDADTAAGIIARGIAAGSRTIVVPWQFAVIRGIAALLPRALLRLILARARQRLLISARNPDCWRGWRLIAGAGSA